MSNPIENLKQISELKPSNLNCNIFSVYDFDSLDMQELLCKFFEKINECIDISNATFKLAEWLVSVGLKQEVALTLEKWLNDGTLKDIINETIFNELNNKVDNIINNFNDLANEDIKNIYGLKGDGTEDISNEIMEMINNNRNIRIRGSYIINNVEISKNNCVIYGCGELIGVKDGTMIIINGDNIKIENININSNNCLYSIAIKSKSNNTKIINNKFEGSCGHYIIDDGNKSNIIYNMFDISKNNVITPVVFNGSSNFIFSENQIKNSTGFNIQARFSNNGLIDNNIFDNEIIKEIKKITQPQNILNFNLDYEVARYGVKVNNIVLNNVEITKSGDNIYTLKFINNLNVGDVVEFIGFRSLEPININSECYNISISNNIIKNSGDSGIVLCADYHNGVLDPDNVDDNDYPKFISVINNTINNCAYAGIAETHPIFGSIIKSNKTLNTGIISSSNFASGIFITGINKIISDNECVNSKYGVYINSYGFKSSLQKNQIIVGSNIFDNVTQNYFVLGSNDQIERSVNINFINGKQLYSKVKIGENWIDNMPPSDYYFTFNKSGAGWTLSQDRNISHNDCIKLNSGSFGEVVINDVDVFTDSIIEINLLCRKEIENSKCYFDLFYGFVGSQYVPIRFELECGYKSFKRNTIRMNIPIRPFATYGTGLAFRIEGDNDIYIKDINVNNTPIN